MALNLVMSCLRMETLSVYAEIIVLLESIVVSSVAYGSLDLLLKFRLAVQNLSCEIFRFFSEIQTTVLEGVGRQVLGNVIRRIVLNGSTLLLKYRLGSPVVNPRSIESIVSDLPW